MVSRLTSLLLLLPLSLFAAEPAEKPSAVAPVLSDGVGFGQLLQVFLALLAIIAFIMLLAWLLRRVGQLPFAGQGAIRILAGISLGQRERAVLVQVGETQLLLGVAPGRVETLHVLDKPIVTQGGQAPGERFAEKLAAVLKREGVEKQ